MQGVTPVVPEIVRIFALLLWMTGAAFLLIQGTFVVSLVRSRHRPGRLAGDTHGNRVIEIIWTVIPALILAFLAFHSQRVV